MKSKMQESMNSNTYKIYNIIVKMIKKKRTASFILANEESLDRTYMSRGSNVKTISRGS